MTYEAAVAEARAILAAIDASEKGLRVGELADEWEIRRHYSAGCGGFRRRLPRDVRDRFSAQVGRSCRQSRPYRCPFSGSSQSREGGQCASAVRSVTSDHDVMARSGRSLPNLRLSNCKMNLNSSRSNINCAKPDPITLRRVHRFFAAVRSLLGAEITTAWLARALVRADDGPMLDAPRLGPALRTLGFQPVRRRRGTRRVSTWMHPGAPVPRAGRPRVQERLAR